MGTRSVELFVNDVPIQLDYFVQGFIDHTVGGIVGGLKGTGTIRDLNVSIDKDQVSISLNHEELPLNAFVNNIVRNTLIGMISSLKGVNEIKDVTILIRR